MPIVKRQAIVQYTPQQMYALVDGIELYPKFIPACKATEILSRNEDEVQATLHFAHGAIQKSFSTCNRLQQHKMIEIKLLHGPFKHLEGFWMFKETPENGCEVSLDLEFEFSSRLLSFAFGPIFHQITNTLVDAFVKRAKEVYGDSD